MSLNNDTNNIKILKHFKENLDATKLVSKKDILSLEESLGYNLITGVRHIDYFTLYPSSMHLDEIHNIIDKEVTRINAANIVGSETMNKLYNKLDMNIRDIMRTLNFAYKIRPEVLEAMKSDELTMTFEDPLDLHKGKLMSLLDVELLTVINKYHMYFYKIVDLCKKPNDKDNIYADILQCGRASNYDDPATISPDSETIFHNSSLTTYSFLNFIDLNPPSNFSLLKSDHYAGLVLHSPTLREFIEFINKASVYQSRLAVISNDIYRKSSYTSMLLDGDRWDTTYTTSEYNCLANLVAMTGGDIASETNTNKVYFYNLGIVGIIEHLARI